MKETVLQTDIRIAAGLLPGAKFWRNNVGEAWQGRAVRSGRDVVIHDATRVVYGLCVGSADLIGLTQIVVGPEHVGHKIAVFTAGEVKLPGKHPSADQVRWLDFVRNMGGRAAVIRSPDDALQLVGSDAAYAALVAR